MPKIDQVREFRRGVAPASDEVRRRAYERLARAIDAEDRLEAALDDGGMQRSNVGRWIVKRRTPVLALGVVVAAGAAALFLSAPWQNSPGFLAKAHAALAPPPGTILHMKSVLTTTSADPACTVTLGPNERWIDQTPPYRFRDISVEPDVPSSNDDVRVLVCAKGGAPTETGGPVNRRVVRFSPPNTLVDVSPAPIPTRPPDPISSLRAAIGAGRAHDEGKTTLDGRTVELIRVDPPRPPNCGIPCPTRPLFVYVDPDTFHLVAERRGPEDISDGIHVVRVKLVRRYLTYEYLPRTPENLALTDISAQHPTACVRGLWADRHRPNSCH